MAQTTSNRNTDPDCDFAKNAAVCSRYPNRMILALLKKRLKEAAGSRGVPSNEKGGFPRSISMEELLHRQPILISVITRRKMYCAGCLLAKFHDVNDAAIEHGIDADDLHAELLKAADEGSENE